MRKAQVKVMIGLIGVGELTAYQLEVTIGDAFCKSRWLLFRAGEELRWGQFATIMGDWLDSQLVSTLKNLAGHELEFSFLNGLPPASPVDFDLFEMVKGVIEENFQTRFLEGRMV